MECGVVVWHSRRGYHSTAVARSHPSILPIALDRDSDVPVGVQLAWHLRSQIVGGDLEAGQRLPGVRELGAAAGVNANTVRAVYARLEADDLISTEHGRGTFVAARAGADERLAEIVERAAREALQADLDPREVAAALFVNRPGGATREAARGGAAQERRAVRREIAELEQRLADGHLQRLLAAATDEPDSRSRPRTATGGRILSLEELSALRDELAGRVALLEGAERARGRGATARRRAASEPDLPPANTPARPGRLKLTPGPVPWSLRYQG